MCSRHPEDESTSFETCSRQQKLNINLENYAFRRFVLYNCITIHSAKKNAKFCFINYIKLVEIKHVSEEGYISVNWSGSRCGHSSKTSLLFTAHQCDFSLGVGGYGRSTTVRYTEVLISP